MGIKVMNDTILRQWAMLRLIPRSPRKVTTTVMLGRLERAGFNTTLRTIQRDLNTLSTAFPLISDDARPQGWSWPIDAPQIDVPALDELSAVGFALAQSQLEQIFPKATLDYLQPWFRSANQVLKDVPSHRGSTNQYFRVISRSMNLLPPKIHPGVQEVIYEGVLKKTQLRIQYLARGEKKLREYNAHPLAVVIADSVCYLVCTINSYKDVRQLALHRIQKASLSPEKSRRPKGFQLDNYLTKGNLGFLRADKPISLEILIRSKWAHHLYETPISENQSLEALTNDWTKVKVTVPDTSQLRWWLRGFGPDLQVLKPAQMRLEFGSDVDLQKKFYKI
jgi:predicted DNA-binding transcriptional regulator YafY